MLFGVRRGASNREFTSQTRTVRSWLPRSFNGAPLKWKKHPPYHTAPVSTPIVGCPRKSDPSFDFRPDFGTCVDNTATVYEKISSGHTSRPLLRR